MAGFLFAVFMFVIIIIVLIGAVRSIKIQHEGQIGLIEAWGRYSRIVVPGRYMLLPWERVAGELPLQIFEYETPPQKLVLKGGAPLTLSVIIYFQIEHAHKTPGAPTPARIIGREPAPVGTLHSAGGVPGPGRGIGIDPLEPGSRTIAQRRAVKNTRTNSATTMLRRVLGRTSDQLDIHQAAYRARYLVRDWHEATEREAVATLQKVFSKVGVAEDIFGDVDWQETLGERVREHLTEKTERWGVQVIDVAFKDVTFSEMTFQNMFAEPRATREGHIRTLEAKNYQQIAELLHLTPAQLLSWRQIEIMRELAKSPQPRVMFTTDVMNHGASSLPMQPAMMAGAADGAPPATPYRGGYLGNEPPPPALPAGMPGDRGMQAPGPAAGVPMPRGDSGLTAPGLQDVDQQ